MEYEGNNDLGVYVYQVMGHDVCVAVRPAELQEWMAIAASVDWEEFAEIVMKTEELLWPVLMENGFSSSGEAFVETGLG